MKFLVSLLGLGISGGGIFIGTLQQNLSNTKTEVDRLFEEIEELIKEFSEKHHITEKIKEEIRNVSNKEYIFPKEDDGKQKSKNTLQVWTDIWISMLDGYVDSLWKRNSDGGSQNENLESRVFSKKDKEVALKAAEKNVENEKQKFEEKLDSQKRKIEEIYQKMKKFLQIMKLPKKYNSSTYEYAPYEEYVMKILEE